MTYDPAFMNTASCRSSITYIDGDKGILRYRGYPVDQLAEHATYLEVAYLLINGELPTQKRARRLHAATSRFTRSCTKTCGRSSTASATTRTRWACWSRPSGALSTFYPEAKHVVDAEIRRAQMVRLIAKMPTIAAWSYRHSVGMPFVYPVQRAELQRELPVAC